MDVKWWEVNDNRIELAVWLIGQGRLNTAPEALRFFEKPWNWDIEWDAMNAEDVDYTCPTCDGKGMWMRITCPDCGGSGFDTPARKATKRAAPVVDEAMIERAAEAIARYWWETGGEWGNLPEPNDDDIACAKVGLRAALEVTEDE